MYSVPKRDRQLLTKEKEKVPGAGKYTPDKTMVLRKEPAFSMGKSGRDVSFSKYNSVHSELVAKGLQ